jgi:hypothetical protein
MKRLLLSTSLPLFLPGILSVWIGCGTQRQEAPPAFAESAQEKPRKSADQREELPSELKCSADDHPTLWEGRVISFHRGNEKTEITIRADWDADYSVVISHPGSDAPPLRLFRFKGQPFTQSDWPLIESEKNKLKSDIRAKVWVCTDKSGKNPLIMRIDWLGSKTKRSKATP